MLGLIGDSHLRPAILMVVGIVLHLGILSWGG